MSDMLAEKLPGATEVTTKTFRHDVLTDSLRLPVIVEFYSTRDEASRKLSVDLQKLANQIGDKLKYVRMNGEQNAQLAAQIGVQSLPAVVLFERGQPTDGFMGALPENQIRAFLERLVGPVSGVNDEVLKHAEALFEAGQVEDALASTSQILAQEPENIGALALQVRLLTHVGHLDEAEELAGHFSTEAQKDKRVVSALAALQLARQSGQLGDLAPLHAALRQDENDRQARFDLALLLNSKGNRAEAAEALLHIIRHDRVWNEDGARKQLLQFFEAWGPMDPATIAARRKLSSMLFS